jgi:hypothetical protein
MFIVVTLVSVVQMPVMKVIDVTVVLNGLVATVRAVNVVV